MQAAASDGFRSLRWKKNLATDVEVEGTSNYWHSDRLEGVMTERLWQIARGS